ncbi:MAG TPA: hypothetical protein VMU82_01875, partial [Acetobacteraceae bacterium]|nr:hypothetical protein [Acetobacteraceae bacterium]
EAAATGLPLLRPPMLHFPADRALWGLHDHVMLGPDLLLAPVHKPDAARWEVRLPAGADWVHVWSGTHFAGGQSVRVAASIGAPPAFLRADSTSTELRQALGAFAAAL